MKGKTGKIIGTGLAAVAVGWGILRSVVPERLFPDTYSTLLYSAEGELSGGRVAPDGQWRFPPADSVPERFARCLIRYEDKRFPYHPGVDPLAIGRAIRANLAAGRVVSGGSTLTMQLARIARGNRERTLPEKAKELCWALYLETTHSKRELLGLYAAHAPFGGNVVGVEAAAWRYFGRSAAELSWAESATLAVLPNSPALIHPGRNRARLKEKRDHLLRTLHEEGILSRTEYELAIREPLPGPPLPLPDEAPHLLERLAQERPGERIRSSLRQSLQRRTQELANRYAREYGSNHVHNVAALIADVESGEVLAYAGNASFPADARRGNQVDIIVSPRSTGSLLKPFLYAGMLHDGALLPATLVPDVPLRVNGFAPQNFNKRFYGAVPAREAIERSLNVPLVRMLTRYNTGRFMALLRQWGMTTLRFPESHYGASLILGGAEGTLWDMTGMYASAARTLGHYHAYGGRYTPGDVHPLTPYPSPAKEKPIRSVADDRLTDRTTLSHAALWYTFEAMSALSRPEEEADWQQFASMKRIAWKTGTSYGGRDAWAIGVTPRFAVGVWVGNASGEGRPGLTGVGYAAPLLFDLFSLLPGGEWFEMPYDELERMPICRESGHRASPACGRVDTLYMPLSGRNTALCPYHRLVHLTADGRFRVNSSCESPERMVTRPWFVLPPAQAYYYKNYHEYPLLPPFKPGCAGDRDRQIELIYPEHGAVIYLPKSLSGERERVVFEAAHARPEAIIYWHLDERYLGETGGGKHQIAAAVEPGKHLLTLIDDEGNQRRIAFEVK